MHIQERFKQGGGNQSSGVGDGAVQSCSLQDCVIYLGLPGSPAAELPVSAELAVQVSQYCHVVVMAMTRRHGQGEESVHYFSFLL